MESLTLSASFGGGGGGAPSAGVTPAGSAGQIQFHDGQVPAGLGASADLTWDDSTKELGIGGDIKLDDGGTYTTTLQMVTATADRTISFPDATGTFGLVAGSSGQVTYNSAGAQAGDSGLTYDATSGALTVGGKTVTADAPVIDLSQTWNDAATTFTGLKLNVTNTASAIASNLLDLQVGGTSKFAIKASGAALFSAGSYNFISDAGALIFTDSAGIRSFLARSDFSIIPLTAQFKWGNLTSFASDTGLARDSAGVVKVTNGSTGTGYIKQVPVLVSALPSAATVGAGTRGFVSDATATTFASVVTGSGTASTAGTVPVYSDGTDWRIG